jgi:AcrR family transcriptional regulator
MFVYSYNMRVPSDLSSARRRVPQQERGERRVASLLEAAAAVIAEVGYDAATMTAMAERAEASIGAMYQYFPNKEAVVRALRAQYGDEMKERWKPLTLQAAKLSVAALVDRMFEVLVQFIEERPAYIPLLSAPGKFARDPPSRNRLREDFAKLFREKRPELSPEEAFRIANVKFQVVKGMTPLYAEAKPREREALVQEFKLALTAYLSARLRA